MQYKHQLEHKHLYLAKAASVVACGGDRHAIAKGKNCKNRGVLPWRDATFFLALHFASAYTKVEKSGKMSKCKHNSRPYEGAK